MREGRDSAMRKWGAAELSVGIEVQSVGRVPAH
jgi:hypothetical protein